MTRDAIRALLTDGLLIAAASLPAAAQTPHSDSRTSAIEQLGLADTAKPALTAGIIRELRCRGKPDIDLHVQQEPSPRNPKLVAMALRYERPQRTRVLGQEGMGTVDYGISVANLPGTCSWNPGGWAELPPEPGIVYFDLDRDAQAGAQPGARDTTINAAAFFPDLTSLPRYLSDPDRYWVFFVDDVTNFAISYGAWPRGGGVPPSTAGDHTGSNAYDPSISRHAASTATGTETSTSSSERPTEPVSDSSTHLTEPSLKADTSQVGGTRVRRQIRLARGIRDLTAVPGPVGVRLRFHAERGSSVRVQFSQEPPRWDASRRRWTYPGARDAHWLAQVRRRSGGAGYEAVPRIPLDQGVRYHYLITVTGEEAASPIAQRTGSFRAAVGP